MSKPRTEGIHQKGNRNKSFPLQSKQSCFFRAKSLPKKLSQSTSRELQTIFKCWKKNSPGVRVVTWIWGDPLQFFALAKCSRMTLGKNTEAVVSGYLGFKSKPSLRSSCLPPACHARPPHLRGPTSPQALRCKPPC